LHERDKQAGSKNEEQKKHSHEKEGQKDCESKDM